MHVKKNVYTYIDIHNINTYIIYIYNTFMVGFPVVRACPSTFRWVTCTGHLFIVMKYFCCSFPPLNWHCLCQCSECEILDVEMITKQHEIKCFVRHHNTPIRELQLQPRDDGCIALAISQRVHTHIMHTHIQNVCVCV